jgi:hypothetical protein
MIAGFTAGGFGIASATAKPASSSPGAATTSGPESNLGASHMDGHCTPPAAAGKVESVGKDTFTVKGRDGTTVSVDVSSSTTYKDRAVASPSFANVTKGEMVGVQGTTASGKVTAKSVLIGFRGGSGHNRGHGGFAPTSAS